MSAPSRSAASVAHRLRSGTFLLVALAASWAIFGVINLVLGRPRLAVIHGGAFLSVAALLVATRGVKTDSGLRSHGAAAITAIALFTIALWTGQSSSIAWLYLFILPVFVGQGGGLVAIAVWAVLGALSVGLVFLSERIAIIEPEYIFTDVERSIGGIVLTVLALFYTILVRRLAETQFRDLEERERTIRKQADQLEGARAETVDARDQAIATSESKTLLMARVSHEIRTPLNGLLGLSEVLEGAKLNPAQADIVRTIRSSAQSLRQIVEDLLDVTRIQEGHLTLRREQTDLRELVGDVLDTFASIAADKGVELSARVAPELPARGSFDGLRVRQILSNLVSNGLKFTERGEVRVTLSGTVDDAMMSLIFAVTDTGPGIPAQRLSSLFEPFVQLDGPFELRRQGAGLGLWIAHQLVSTMGGELRVESELGVGTTFSVALRVPRGPLRPAATPGLLLPDFRLTVLDALPSARATIESHASYGGFDVQIVESLSGLKSSLDSGLPTVVMARVDSASQVPPLRRAIPSSVPLVLAVTPTHELAHGALPTGVSAVTLRPYRFSRLRAVIDDVIEGAETSATTESLPPQRSMDCLVVDDDPTNRKVARLLLQRANHRVTEATDGSQALAAIARGRYDVVFLDLHMPDMSGIDVATRVRAELDPQSRLWIVALTAAASDEDRQACLAAGMDDFVAKPIEVGLLRAALERARRGSRKRTRQSVTMEAQAIDREVLDPLIESLEDEARPLIQDYLENASGLIVELRPAVERKDQKDVHRISHTLAASSALVGALHFSKLFKGVETVSARGEFPSDKLLERADSLFARVEAELNKVMAELS